jgi:type II secretory pathway pseudopilin PulG
MNPSLPRTRLQKLASLGNTYKTQGGFSSVELGLTLFVVALIITAAVLFYQDNVRKNSINTNLQYLQVITGNAKTTYGARNQYGAVNLAVAIQGHVIPDALRDGAPPVVTASNPFGAPIAIAPATTLAAGTPDVLDLTWGNVPRNQCAEIVTGVSNVMRQITVAGVVVKALDAPLNIGTTTTQCETNENVAIVFRIGRG